MLAMNSNHNSDDLREFFLMVRRALLMIVRWIESKYNIEPAGGRVTE
jgi:hypothetical protein